MDVLERDAELERSEGVGAATYRALVALGDSPAEVAATLERGGWRGDPGCLHSCPVAVYLMSIFGEFSVAAVGSDAAYVQLASPVIVEPVLVTMPEPVAAFVSAFDGGNYRDELSVGVVTWLD